MQEEFLKIPKERVAVLIGAEGSTKRKVEKLAAIRLKVDSGNGEVEISSAKADGFAFMKAVSVVKAIARGFNPEIALLLLKGDYVFIIIDLGDYAKTKKSMMRLKGRVIGLDGKSRMLIEELSETHIVVYGKTASIIGHSENAAIARKAIESLLMGSRHSNVYRWLEKKRKDQRMGML